MAKRVGVLLSGCGGFDGSDLHEAVLALLTLERRGAEIVCTAPNIPQHHVLNHLNQEEMAEERNVLVESARIARGNILDTTHFQPDQVDALIIPGGFGTVKSLSGFALSGPDAQVHPQVEKLIKGIFNAGKPIGARGIAAAVVVKALSVPGIEVTTGSDPGTAAAMETMGACHMDTQSGHVHVDVTHKIITTPADAHGASLQQIFTGVELLVKNLLNLVK